MRIHLEPDFHWWVPHTLRKGSCLLSKIKTLFHKNDLKLGLEVPKTTKQALGIDLKNGNAFWRDAIDKEMSGIKKAFKFLDNDLKTPPGFKRVNCHIIFYV